MPTSAQRLGLDVMDLELELRLRRIETELENRVRTTDLSDGDTVRVTDIPTVTGLRVSGSTAGAITIAWTAVPVSDLKRYEIDIAEDLGFSTNLVTTFVAGTEFNYTTNSDTGGGGGTDVFVRVRARAQSGNVGLYSIVLNATTGQAQSDDIAADSVRNTELSSSAIIQLALKEYVTPRGFHMSNDTTDAVNDLQITAGVARGEADDGSIELTTTFIKRMNEVWLPGDAGGFPAAISRTDATNYRVFVFAKLDGTGADAGFDVEEDASNLIARAVAVDSGYAGAIYRQIGWIKWVTTAAGIRPFFSPARDPEVVIWQDNIVNVALLTNSQNSKLYALDVPPDVMAHFVFTWIHNNGSAGDKRIWIKSPAMTDAACDGTNFTHKTRRKASSNGLFTWEVETEVDSSSQVRARFDNTSNGTRKVFSTGFRFIR